MKSLSLKMPYQAELNIETDCLEIISKLELKYGNYIIEREKAPKNDIKILRKDANTYTVIIGESCENTSRPIFYIGRYLFENPSYNSKIIALHGAAVEHNGFCHIFLASTTSGKTTLTSYLTSNGLGYITDDCVLLDRQDLKIYPFTTPIHLREGGLEVLKKYNTLPNDIKILDEPPSLLRYTYTPSLCAKQALPIKSIYFIERTQAENHISRMSTTERMSELMKSPITPYDITKEYLSFLARLAKIDCFHLKYYDMDFVKEVIFNESCAAT